MIRLMDQKTSISCFAWNRKCILLGVKQLGYVVSVLSDTSCSCLSISGTCVQFITGVSYICCNHMGTC